MNLNRITAKFRLLFWLWWDRGGWCLLYHRRRLCFLGCRTITVRAHGICGEIHFSTIGALGDLVSYLYSAIGADRCFVAYLMSTFRTLYYSHIILSSILHNYLPMLEPYFAHAMPSHKTAFIHISVDAVDMTFTGVLPDNVVTVVGKIGLFVGL